MGKRLRAMVCASMASLAFVQNAHAQAAAASADLFNISLGTTIRNWATRMDYSLSDARVGETLTAIGDYASGLVSEGLIPAALEVGGVATWGSLIGLGALAAGAGAIALDNSGSFSWLFTGTSSNPAITVTSPASTSTSSTSDASVTVASYGASAGTSCSIVANSTNNDWVFAVPTTQAATTYSVWTYFSSTTNLKPGSNWLSYGTATCSGNDGALCARAERGSCRAYEIVRNS